MSKKASILLLALTLGFYALKDAFLFAWYEFDRASFAGAWCENIDRPELECHGKCQLPQLLEEQPSESKASGSLQLPKMPADFFLQPTVKYVYHIPVIVGCVPSPNHLSVYDFLPLQEVFRPPRLSMPGRRTGSQA